MISLLEIILRGGTKEEFDSRKKALYDRMNQINQELFDNARYLYHRTTNVQTLLSIINDRRVKLRSELNKYKDLTKTSYVSLTTNIRNHTGGKFLIIFDKEKLMGKNNLVAMQYGTLDYITDKQKPWSNPYFFEHEKEVCAIGGLNFDSSDIVAMFMDKLNWYGFAKTKSDKGLWTKEQNIALSKNIQILDSEEKLMQYANY